MDYAALEALRMLVRNEYNLAASIASFDESMIRTCLMASQGEEDQEEEKDDF